MDETGLDTFLHREYARAPRGQRITGMVPGKKFNRTNIVAGKCCDRILSPLQYDGSTDSRIFEFWFGKILLKEITAGSFIIMDNASFHRKSKLIALAEKARHRLIFLPPYSPELNHIEYFWNWLKRYLRKILPVHSSFDAALCSAFQVL